MDTDQERTKTKKKHTHRTEKVGKPSATNVVLRTREKKGIQHFEPSNASNTRSHARQTHVDVVLNYNGNVSNTPLESKRAKRTLTCDEDPRDLSTTSPETNANADRSNAKARQAEGANARCRMRNQEAVECRRNAKERRDLTR